MKTNSQKSQKQSLLTHLQRLKSSSIFICVIIFAVILTACTTPSNDQQTSSDNYPMTIENCGREITIASQPERIYVIGGEAGTLIHSAGGAELVSTFSPLTGEPLGEAEAALSEAEQFPIRTASEMSREMIIGAGPDLLVTFGLSGFGPEDLEEAGIPAYIINGYCGGFGAGQSLIVNPLQGIYDDVEMLGTIMGTSQQAEEAVEEMKNRVEAVREEAEEAGIDKEKTAALYIAGPDSGLGAYGKRSMIHQQLELAGLKNVLGDADERYFEPSIESFIDSAPERIIALYESGDTTEEEVRTVLMERPDISHVPAILSRDIIVLDFYYSGHGSLAIEGLEQLFELIATGNER